MANRTDSSVVTRFRVRLTDWVDSAGELEGWRLDAVFTLLALWMIGGIAWDFNVHAHGISFAEEGFLTAPHVTFYSAFVAIALLIAIGTYANYRRGTPLSTAVPTGYRLGALGVVLFMLGGPGDFLWHSHFGFEVGVEALTSPSHLLLAVGGTLFLSSALRATWARETAPSGVKQAPMLVSATFIAVLVTFFTVYRNPLVRPVGAPGGPSPDHSFLGILWFTAIVVALGLTLLRRFRLVVGAFTLVLGLLGLLVTAITPSFDFLPALLAAGVVADGLYRWIRDRWSPARTVRLLGVTLPVLLFTVYFATVALLYGLSWSVHVWTGAVVSAGLVGLLVSYVVVPSDHSDTASVT
jgi:hypothetical protein